MFSSQATFSFSAAAGILWVAAFSGLLSPQRARRASLDSLKGSPSAPAGDEQYDMAAETLAGSNGGPPGADPASVRRKQQQVCTAIRTNLGMHETVESYDACGAVLCSKQAPVIQETTA